MSNQGSRLGRLLYYVLLALVGLLAFAALCGVLALVIALFFPDAWPGATTIRVEGGRPIPLDTASARATGALVMLGALALAAMVVVPLVGLARSAAVGTPFVADNVARLRVIAGAFAFYALLGVALPLLAPAGAGLLTADDAPRAAGPILMALVTLVLAEVFREGVRLREDAEGTV